MVDFDTVSLEVGYFGYAFYDENTLTSDDVNTLEQVAENYFCEAREKFNKYLEEHGYYSRMGLIKKKRTVAQ